MSRVTEALLKSRDRPEGAFTTVEDLTKTTRYFAPRPARTGGTAPEGHSAKIVADHFESPFEPKAPTDELIQLAQRLFPNAAAELSATRSLLFAGVGPDGGSAAVCAGTAEALSRQAIGSVCVVEADLRSPSVGAAFGVTGARGLSNVLLREQPLTDGLTRIRGNLWVLGAGSRCVEARPLLTGAAFRGILRELRASFDYVLIDFSAHGAALGLATFAAAVDGVVLVMDAGSTRREVVRRTTDTLRTAQVKILGAVLTNRTYPIPEAIYRRL